MYILQVSDFRDFSIIVKLNTPEFLELPIAIRLSA